ncbi:MAG: polyprenyl synthetase family protein [Sandaracinaceae bacterium]
MLHEPTDRSLEPAPSHKNGRSKGARWSADASISELLDRMSRGELVTLPHSAPLERPMIRRVDRDVVAPLRLVAERGGKGWRAMLSLTVCEALGGDPRPLEPWTGVMELLHVGSLIVDDVQDQSELRRGGVSCHRVFGEARAVNAGCSAYFLLDEMLEALPLTEAAKLDMYRLFFQALRAAHAGQGVDLGGLADAARDAVDCEEVSGLVRTVLDVHRLKTGWPVVLCAQLGACCTGASRASRVALSHYAMAMGTALQIGDDLLSLRGFEAGLKTSGEDLCAGKITAPVAVTLATLPPAEARALLERLLNPDKTDAEVAALQAQIEHTGAPAECLRIATELLDAGWAELVPHLNPGPARDALAHYGTLFLHRQY